MGKKPGVDPKIITVDSFCHDQDIKHLDILHADIQGFELDMLMGAKEMLSQKKIDYIFISTHSNELHEQCLEILGHNQYAILASANLDETYSYDGLIVAKKESLQVPSQIVISKRKAGHSI